MAKLIDLVGKRFGRLVVLGLAEKVGRARFGGYWRCRCDCGVVADVTGPGLRGGKANSCGCIRSELIGASRRRHGVSNSRAQRIWSDMKRRCYSPKRRDYPHYGGRGITVCERWLSFDNFLADMGQPPDGMSLDRKDNNQGYSPDNCRWATKAQQMRNTRRNIMVATPGGPVILRDYCASAGVAYNHTMVLMRQGLSPEAAVARQLEYHRLHPRTVRAATACQSTQSP